MLSATCAITSSLSSSSAWSTKEIFANERLTCPLGWTSSPSFTSVTSKATNSSTDWFSASISSTASVAFIVLTFFTFKVVPGSKTPSSAVTVTSTPLQTEDNKVGASSTFAIFNNSVFAQLTLLSGIFSSSM